MGKSRSFGAAFLGGERLRGNPVGIPVRMPLPCHVSEKTPRGSGPPSHGEGGSFGEQPAGRAAGGGGPGGSGEPRRQGCSAPRRAGRGPPAVWTAGTVTSPQGQAWQGWAGLLPACKPGWVGGEKKNTLVPPALLPPQTDLLTRLRPAAKSNALRRRGSLSIWPPKS